MRKISILAWILFSLIASMALFGVFYSLWVNRSASQDLLVLAADIFWGLLPIEFAFMATLILSRQPRNAIGWLLMLTAIAQANDRFLVSYYTRLASLPFNPSPAFLLGLWFSGWSWLLLIFPVFFIMLLFPTGQPVSSRWRWVTFYALGVLIYFFIVVAFQQNFEQTNVDFILQNPFGFIPNDWFEQYLWVTFGFGLFSMILLSVTSIIVRYRGAQVVEREQIKWLLYACGLFATVYFISLVQNLSSDKWGVSTSIYFLVPIALMSIPAAIAISILRYRLWDIDVIIRRTLIYGALTITLGLVFFGGVALLQWLFGKLSGVENSPIAIVVTTLMIAALFNPLRKRIQSNIDQRFYRRKYDAQKMVERFSAAARNEVEIEQLTAHLAEIVTETMQPEQVTVWLKPLPSQLRKASL